jgi:hypothetical protein
VNVGANATNAVSAASIVSVKCSNQVPYRLSLGSGPKSGAATSAENTGGSASHPVATTTPASPYVENNGAASGSVIVTVTY